MRDGEEDGDDGDLDFAFFGAGEGALDTLFRWEVFDGTAEGVFFLVSLDLDGVEGFLVLFLLDGRDAEPVRAGAAVDVFFGLCGRVVF